MERRLYRSRKDRLFLGVCSALGAYYGIDPVILRVITVLVTVVSSIFPGLVAYFILALIIPLEDSKASSAQEGFRENLKDLENSVRNWGKHFKNNDSRNSARKSVSPHQNAAMTLPAPTRSKWVIYIIAIVLVVVGLIFFILELFPGIWLEILPITLVVAGIIIVILVLTRNKQP